MWWYYANDIFWGRMALQTAATAKFVYDVQKDTDDPVSDTIDFIWFAAESALIWNPLLKPAAIGTALRMTLGSTLVSTVLAPVAAGYVIGATVGTAIAGEVWGEEGAQTALGFYSAGLLPGTEAPDLTDYQYILKPTKPGGPVSLYDVAKKGVDNTLRGAGWLLDKRPRMYRHPSPYMI